MPFGIIDVRTSEEEDLLPGTEHLIGDQSVAVQTGDQGRELKRVLYRVIIHAQAAMGSNGLD